MNTASPGRAGPDVTQVRHGDMNTVAVAFRSSFSAS
jgi:hypothetical protein